MAQELTINLNSFSFIKGVQNWKIAPGPILVDVAGLHVIHDQVNTTNTASNIPKGAVNIIGFFYLKNLSTVDIEIAGNTTTFDGITLGAGRYTIGFWNRAAMAAKSASPSILEYLFIDA